jgi:transposase
MLQKIATKQVADYYLGCDVAKAKIDIALINAHGQELWHDTVANEVEVLATLLLTLAGTYPEATVQCVVEATSTYHYVLLEASELANVACRVYNPILTKSGIRSTVRGKKTDRSDALVIARLGLRGEGRVYTPEPYIVTKHYARSCQKLSTLSSSFQQYEKHLSGLLREDITTNTTKSLEAIQRAIKDARIQLVADLVTSTSSEVSYLLQTIPGVGSYIAASLIGEIQDINRFGSAKTIIAYAGLDPRIRQSGKSLNSTGRLTKRGSSYLRRNLFIAANVARRHDPQFKALYNKKRAEGKSFKEANCVVARKLLKVVRSVWLSGKAYTVPDCDYE